MYRPHPFAIADATPLEEKIERFVGCPVSAKGKAYIMHGGLLKSPSRIEREILRYIVSRLCFELALTVKHTDGNRYIIFGTRSEGGISAIGRIWPQDSEILGVNMATARPGSSYLIPDDNGMIYPGILCP